MHAAVTMPPNPPVAYARYMMIWASHSCVRLKARTVFFPGQGFAQVGGEAERVRHGKLVMFHEVFPGREVPEGIGIRHFGGEAGHQIGMRKAPRIAGRSQAGRAVGVSYPACVAGTSIPA